MLKSRQRRTGVGSWIAEAVLIMLSISLGLMANEWRVDREQEKDALTALAFIREEMERNYNKMESVLPYHEQMSTSFAELMNRALTTNTTISAADMVKAMPDGFTTPLISRNSWELANQTGAINHMDFELAQELSQVYDLQAFYQQKVNLIGENVYVAGNLDTKDQGATAIALGLLANDISVQERRLVKHYPAVIARVDSVIAASQ